MHLHPNQKMAQQSETTTHWVDIFGVALCPVIHPSFLPSFLCLGDVAKHTHVALLHGAYLLPSRATDSCEVAKRISRELFISPKYWRPDINLNPQAASRLTEFAYTKCNSNKRS
jgi:hypothetical protein